ncbi:MAG TPA: outer membrane beta-barrel protein [Candidatus Sulfotelmatobacter sp.]|jgi:opacity protein-like surface antigen
MLKAAGIAAVLFVFAGLASAQIPSGNIFLGFSYERTNSTALSGSNLVTTTFSHPNLHGWEASFEGKVLPLVGIVGDVSGHYGSQSFVEVTPNGPQNINVTGHEQEYLVGPRLSVPVGKFTPFGELMVGVAHIHTGGTAPSPSNTSFAYALGGGLDYRVFRPIALRVEGDYLRTKFYSTRQNNFRLSVGVVFRF